MAITAAITLSSATCNRGESVTGILTFTNGNASDVTVVEVNPAAFASGTTLPAPMLLGMPNLITGSNVTVPASGTLAITFGVTPQAPEFMAFSAAEVDAGIPGAVEKTFAFGISAQWKTSDGTSGVATPTTLTVTSP